VTFVIGMFRMLRSAGRAMSTWRPLRGGRASVAIALGLLLAALFTFPIRVQTARNEIWLLPPAAPSLAAGVEIPVFCLAAASPAVRCGLARQVADGRLLFLPYRSARFPAQTLPILTSADVGLLWALADPQGRRRIRDAAVDLTQELVSSAHDLTESATWQREYRDSLRDVLRRIAQRAWDMPDTQYAFHALVRATSVTVADSVARDIGPVIAPYVADAIWGAVATNTLKAWSIIRGAPLDFSTVGPALNEALRDPAVERVLGQLGPRVMALPQAELLTERLVANLAAAAKADTEALDLLTRIVTDPRLGPPLGHVREDAGLFVRELGGVLWGLGDTHALNSLAGVALRSALAGAAQRIIMIADPAHAQALRHAMPGGVAFLARETAA
jgi:hypothetical protein